MVGERKRAPPQPTVGGLDVPTATRPAPIQPSSVPVQTLIQASCRPRISIVLPHGRLYMMVASLDGAVRMAAPYALETVTNRSTAGAAVALAGTATAVGGAPGSVGGTSVAG